MTFPSTIKYSYRENQLNITHAVALRMNMAFRENSTKKETNQTHYYPKYAVCDTRWSGLGIVDFALLSELAYFPLEASPKNDLPQLLAILFPDRAQPDCRYHSFCYLEL